MVRCGGGLNRLHVGAAAQQGLRTFGPERGHVEVAKGGVGLRQRLRGKRRHARIELGLGLWRLGCRVGGAGAGFSGHVQVALDLQVVERAAGGGLKNQWQRLGVDRYGHRYSAGQLGVQRQRCVGTYRGFSTVLALRHRQAVEHQLVLQTGVFVMRRQSGGGKGGGTLPLQLRHGQLAQHNLDRQPDVVGQRGRRG